MASLSMNLLGTFALVEDGRNVQCVHAPRLRALIAYLILHRDAPRPRREIAMGIWPDSSTAQAHTNLRNLLYLLRHTLPLASDSLRIESASVQWRGDGPWTVDVAEFDVAVAQAEQAERIRSQANARRALEQAVSLYRGDILPGYDEEWILPFRASLYHQYLAALRRLIATLEEERDYARALQFAQRLLQHEPLHEATYLTVMRLHALLGDRAAALQMFHGCAAVLARELSVEPGPQIRGAYERLTRASAPPPRPVTDAPAPPLVGRQDAWRQLREHWQAATIAGSRFVMLVGEAGIGKTRLTEELVTWITHQGIPTATASCHRTAHEVFYAPLVAWLRSAALQPMLTALDHCWQQELARLLPELMAESGPPRWFGVDEGTEQRVRLFDALTRALLAGSQPRLLLIEDMHWCDRVTLDWLAYMLRAGAEARLLLVGTMRPEEVAPDHPLVELLGSWSAHGRLAEIELGPLSRTETAMLAEHVAGRELAPADVDTLYQDSEGYPLFVVEMLRAMSAALPQGNGTVTALARPAPQQDLPGKVQAVLAARLAHLSPLARDLVRTAATIGREFTLDLLLRANPKLDVDTVLRGIDELWQRRIIRELDAQTYVFSHAKLRDAVYLEASPWTRRLLHYRVSQVLADLNGSQRDTVQAQFAYHKDRAAALAQTLDAYQQPPDVTPYAANHHYTEPAASPF
jgi:DNA-binding SARP family transcriptional activator